MKVWKISKEDVKAMSFMAVVIMAVITLRVAIWMPQIF